MAAALCDGKSHSSVMLIAAFPSSYDDVIVPPLCCFMRKIVGLTGSTSVTTIPVPPFSVPAIAESSIGRSISDWPTSCGVSIVNGMIHGEALVMGSSLSGIPLWSGTWMVFRRIWIND